MKKAAKAGSRGVNPQEATIPEEHEEDIEAESPVGKKKNSADARQKKKKNKDDNNGKISNQRQKKKAGGSVAMKKRKRRNRVAYMANVNSAQGSSDEKINQTLAIPLPLTQYVTTLWRRAIRKREGDNPPSPQQSKLSSPQKSNKAEGEIDSSGLTEEYGDISLGMKLSVVGGKVIVQKLNSLADGRASPAQIVGVIQRGDVLLSIDNKSLVSLPIDLMMERLKPLSTPDTSGAYQRTLHLRMAAGEGLDLLEKYEAAEAKKANVVSNGAASEVFSLFPMADQLSGIPMFDNVNTTMPISPNQSQRQYQHQEEKKQTEDDPAILRRQASEKQSPKEKSDIQLAQQQEQHLDDIISSRVAEWRSSERTNFTSEYYAWNETYSELLRPSEDLATVSETKDRPSTKREMLELGRKALLGAGNVSRAMENMDRGKDMRSFRSWNASISLRSGASTRRRYVLDAVSLPVRLEMKSASPKGANAGNSLASGTSGSDIDDVDGDALLLRLAAHDEIWRSQVIEALKNARGKLADGSEESDEEEEVTSNDAMEDPITKELGAFLFGETLAKVVTKKKKSKALPPEEITAVLFDLSTNLASTMPDEVAVGDGTASAVLKSSLVPFLGRRNPEAGSSVILATRFVLDDALGVWLETFRPLPWESRRVLWPQSKLSPTGGEGHSRSMFSDNDSLTLDSGNSPTSAYTSATNGNRNQKKDLREQIEDQELDVETRAETCFLVTYYFTQRLLPKLARGRMGDDTKASEEMVSFVGRYGAYMKLHTCLAYAAALKCEGVIEELMVLAQHDLRHREVMMLFSRRHALILYEPTMLSAIVKCLPIIREESSTDRRQILVDVCVSAYPDLCPWQVRQALAEPSEEDSDKAKRAKKHLKNLYYYYLSSLLHPQDGHEAARQNAELVEEWCNLSLDSSSMDDEPGPNLRRKNFLSVASLNSSDHLCYHRDLAMLIKLSMASHEYDLALDLANEIVSHPVLAEDASVLALVLDFMREVTHDALDKGDQHDMFRTLMRVVRLFQHIPRSPEHNFFVFADELHGLLEYKEKQRGTSNKQYRELLELVHFLAREAPPNDFLQAFNTWTVAHDWSHDAVAVLQAVLKRGTRVALNAELSGSLLRLRRARQRLETASDIGGLVRSSRQPEQHLDEPTVWSLMARGLVAIDK